MSAATQTLTALRSEFGLEVGSYMYGNLATPNASNAIGTLPVANGGTGDTEFKVVTADATTTGQSLVDITGLTTGTLIAGATYQFEAVLQVVTTADTTGIKFGVHCTSAPTLIDAIYVGATTTSANLQTMATTGTNGDAVATTAFLTTASTDGAIYIKGMVVLNAAAVFSIQHLKVTSGTSTVKVGSSLRIRQVN
jgi:hypothetical protein